MPHNIKFQTIKKGSAHYAVLRRMAAVPSRERPTIRVLDVPAGSGVLSFPLGFAGFDVTACDLFPEHALGVLSMLTADKGAPGVNLSRLPLPRDLRVSLLGQNALSEPVRVRVVPADMEKPLPFADTSFDYIVSTEGIEHIGGQEQFIREARRVLIPGGRLLLSTPNMLCLRSRLACALTGHRTLKTFIDEYMSVQARENERIYHGHVFLTNYFELRYLLHNNGFRIRRIHASRLSPTSVLLAPFMLPAVVLFTMLAAARWKGKFLGCNDEQRIPTGAKSPYEEITRHVFSSPLLFAGTLIIEAEAV